MEFRWGPNFHAIWNFILLHTLEGKYFNYCVVDVWSMTLVNESNLWGMSTWARKCLFLIHFALFGASFLLFHLVFGETYKMDFWHKASNTIFIIFQKRIIFQQFFKKFTHLMFIWMKNVIKMFFVKSQEWNFSYKTEMIQLIHYQYIMSKYFFELPII
jgi:hypothetical protein